MSKLVPFFLIILSAIQIFPQNISKKSLDEYKAIAKEIVSSALAERKGYDLLAELCEIGPRLSGSVNSMNAIRWAEKKMMDMGLEVTLQPVMVPHWERGDVEKAVIIDSKLFDKKELSISALGGSVDTSPDGITGEVIELKNYEEIESKKDQLKNKIVFISDPMDETLTNTFAGYSKAVTKRSRGAIDAAKYGASAVLIRSITTRHDDVPHVGAMSGYVDSIPKIPAAALGYISADFLSDALLKDPGLKLNIRLSCRTLPDAQSYNVIADLKGTALPDEIVLVGGHFDSWDKGCGAHDNGGGCIQALEVLDLMNRVGIKPKRTLRCVFFINEENGVRGGVEYGAYSDTSSEKHIAAIESDRGVFTPRGFTVKSDSTVLAKIQSWLPILNAAQIQHVIAGYGGVDINSIKTAKALIGYEPDSQRYFDLHHSANDVFGEVSPREMELGAAAIAILAYLISEEGL